MISDFADVSVVIPHFNALDTLCRSVESVIKQSLPVREVIIVDDGSDDFPLVSQRLQKYFNLVSIKLLSRCVNSGASEARNTGVINASSKYIAFLDSDDVWHPDKIRIQYDFMESSGSFLSGHNYLTDLSVRDFPSINYLVVRKVSRFRFLLGNPLFTPTIMVRREGFIPFDSNFKRMEDYKCWFENFRVGGFSKINFFLAGGFKPPIGSSGLSGSVELMHESYIAVLRSLYDQKLMGWCSYILALSVEFSKYPLRVAKLRFMAGVYANKKT